MTTTTNSKGLEKVLEFEDRIITSMLPPREDETVAPGLELTPGYWEQMEAEYQQFAKAA